MNKICMLIPYFGKFPKWFDLYLYSCSHVKEIDFYYFTDCEIPQKIYPNTKFIKMSFKDYCDLVSQKLQINFHPKSAYLLCNIRPFMSIIHNDIVKNYRFWGYSDVDLIYGDMSYLINDTNLKKYDLITTHSDRVAGHFTIIKVGSKYDHIGLKIKNWRTVVCSNLAGVDEKEFSHVVYPLFIFLNILWKYVFSHFMSKNRMQNFYQKAHNVFKTKALFNESYTTPIPQKNEKWIYDLKSNKILAPAKFYSKSFLNKKPLPYLHFLFFKKTPYLKTEDYWRDNFYQIPKNFNFNTSKQIEITRSYIKIK